MSLVSKVERIGAPMGYRRIILASQSDDTDEAEIADGWMISSAGTVKFRTEDGLDVTMSDPTLIGSPHRFRTRRVWNTGTSATVWLLYAYQTGEEGAP